MIRTIVVRQQKTGTTWLDLHGTTTPHEGPDNPSRAAACEDDRQRGVRTEGRSLLAQQPQAREPHPVVAHALLVPRAPSCMLGEERRPIDRRRIGPRLRRTGTDHR